MTLLLHSVKKNIADLNCWLNLFVCFPLQEAEVVPEKVANKYTLKDAPDLRSQFLIEVEFRDRTKAEAAQRRLEEEAAAARKAAEQLEPDDLQGRRVHAWILILLKSTNNAKPDKDDEKGTDTAVPLFVEPSTGFVIKADDPRYLCIESVWNKHNYYV